MKYRVAYGRSLSLWTIAHGRRIVGGYVHWTDALDVALSLSKGPLRRRTWYRDRASPGGAGMKPRVYTKNGYWYVRYGMFTSAHHRWIDAVTVAISMTAGAVERLEARRARLATLKRMAQESWAKSVEMALESAPRNRR